MLVDMGTLRFRGLLLMGGSIRRGARKVGAESGPSIPKQTSSFALEVHFSKVRLPPGKPQWLGGKEFSCNKGDTGQSLGREGPRRRAWLLTPVFLPGKSHGQRSLAGYSQWSFEESDLT